MAREKLTDQEKKSVATAAGVAGGMAVGGGAAYAATRTHGDEAKEQHEAPEVHKTHETHVEVHNTVVENEDVRVVTAEPVETPADNTPTVEVLSYETVEYEGQLMDTATVEVDNTLHRYVDVDRDGYADFEGVDENHDNQFSVEEIHDLAPGTVSMHEFEEAYVTPGGGATDEFLALNNEGPDYVDDAGFSDSGADLLV